MGRNGRWARTPPPHRRRSTVVPHPPPRPGAGAPRAGAGGIALTKTATELLRTPAIVLEGEVPLKPGTDHAGAVETVRSDCDIPAWLKLEALPSCSGP